VREDDTCEVEISERTHKVYCCNSVVFAEHIDIDDVETPVQPPHIALLDADKLTYPLKVRRWAEGDSFIPFGMSGHKKISDLLVDEKVPLAEKRRQLVVCSGDEIVWVVGRRIDDRYRLGDKTDNVLKLVREIY
jgi:tRNA(Ile)-lysidine synthase